MNVATIEVPRAEAEAKLKEYRRRVHKNADDEYSRVLRAYEEAANGKPLLVLSQVMEHAPRDEKGRPMLAIARSDRQQVQVTVRDAGDRFMANQSSRGKSINNAVVTVRRPIPESLTQWRIRVRREAPPNSWVSSEPDGFALVPLVPPDIARGHDLSKRFTLWEVEQWSDTRVSATPDRDPYLLQRIADDLYAVVGEWDLTPLEQAIMRDRARA